MKSVLAFIEIYTNIIIIIIIKKFDIYHIINMKKRRNYFRIPKIPKSDFFFFYLDVPPFFDFIYSCDFFVYTNNYRRVCFLSMKWNIDDDDVMLCVYDYNIYIHDISI